MAGLLLNLGQVSYFKEIVIYSEVRESFCQELQPIEGQYEVKIKHCCNFTVRN